VLEIDVEAVIPEERAAKEAEAAKGGRARKKAKVKR
jgi:hypothetical protein